MGGSLDDLILYLVEEIACCGEQGVHPSGILQYVQEFYNKQSLPHTTNDGIPGSINIDRPFQEKVWTWLTRHPEIRVGRHDQGHNLNLSEVESHNEKHSSPPQLKATRTTAALSHAGDTNLDTDETVDVDREPHVNTILYTALDSQRISQTADSSTHEDPLRVYTTQDRIWYATTGHGPDVNKVPGLDFVLLSLIATQRENGILQADLIRLSGQDKRSVPTRTQRLHEKGYIEKRVVQVRRHKTSLCILKRFATQSAINGQRLGRSAPDLQPTDDPRGGKEGIITQQSMIQMRALIQEIFNILRELQIITWDDLKRKLGVWRLTWQSRVLAVSIRKLEDIGCVKRVRAAGNFQRVASQKYYRCVKLIREPEENEWRRFFDPTTHLSDSFELGHGVVLDPEGDLDEEYQADTSVQVNITSGNDQTEGPGEITTIIPQWNPDRTVSQFLYDLIDRSGTEGISTMDIKNRVFGDFFNRPLESQMARLVETWQISQPLHLRHLAIVRDTALTKKIAHYVHYTYPNFKTMVDKGETFWEAVETIKEVAEMNQPSELAPDAQPDLDEYGFSKLQSSRFQGRHNDASLHECVEASNADAFIITNHDPTLQRSADGTYGVRWGKSTKRGVLRRAPTTPRVKKKLPLTEKTEKTEKPKKGRGRPRKYPRLDDGINPDLGAMTPDELKKFNQSQVSIARYQRNKIKKEAEKRIEEGGDPAKATEDVYAEVSAPKQAVRSPNEGFVSSRGPGTRAHRRPARRLQMDFLGDTTTVTSSIAWPETPIPKPKTGNIEAVISYFPSVAAHTHQILEPAKIASFAKHPELKKPPAKRVRKLKSILGYFPSTAAHTAPLSHVAAPAFKPLPKKRGRPPKITYQYLPSIISTTKPLLNPGALLPKTPVSNLTVKAPKRRGRPAKAIFQYLPSIAAHTQPLMKPMSLPPPNPYLTPTGAAPRSRRKTQKTKQSHNDKDTINEKDFPPSSERERRKMTYEEQSEAIRRTTIGVYLGELADRKTGRGRGRPRKTRLAIFKSTRLAELDWFVEHLPEINDTIGKQAIPMHPAIPTRVNPPDSGMSANNINVPDESQPTGAFRKLSATSIHPLTPNMDKQSLQLAGTKRKRKTSSDVSFQREGLHVVGQKILRVSTNPSDDTMTLIGQESAAIDHLRPCQGTMSSVENTLRDLDDEAVRPKSTDGNGDDGRQQEASSPLHVSQQLEGLDGVETTLDLMPKPIPVTESALAEERLQQSDGRNSLARSNAELESSVMDKDRTITHRQGSDGNENQHGQAQLNELEQIEQRHKGLTGLSSGPVAKVPEEAQEGNPGRSRVIKKITPTGGSMGVLRKRIIMDIVEKCGGVFPGDKELWYPFTTLWTARTDAGKPDQRTLKMTQKALVDAGRLRQLTFSFQNKYGVAVTKTIITLIDIPPTHPKVKDLQTKMIDNDPHPYMPEQVEVSEHLRKTYGQSGHPATQIYSNDLEVDDSSQVQLQYVPAYVRRAAMNKKAEEERKMKLQEKRQQRRQQIEAEELGHPDFTIEGYIGGEVALPSEDAGASQFQLDLGTGGPSTVPGPPGSKRDTSKSKPRVQRLATLMAPSRIRQELTLSQRSGYESRSRPGVDNLAIYQGKDSHANERFPGDDTMHHIPQRRPILGQVRFTEVMGIHSNFDRSPSPEPDMNVPSWLLDPVHNRLQSPGPGNRMLNDMRRGTHNRGVRSRGRDSLQSRNSGESTASGFVRPLQPGARTGLLPSVYLDHTTPRVSAKHNWPFVHLGPASFDPDYEWQEVSTLTDPDHVFHAATGTFSVNFRVLRNARLQLWKRSGVPEIALMILPHSLDDLLSRHYRGKPPTRLQTSVTPEVRFAEELHAVLNWELHIDPLDEIVYNDWRFINHRFPSSHQVVESAASSLEFLPPNSSVIYSSNFTMRKQMNRGRSQFSPPSVTPAKRKAPVAKPKTRRLTSLLAKPSSSLTASRDSAFQQDTDGRQIKKLKLRGSPRSKYIGAEDDRRLMTAVIVVRTLIGGIERNIDWVLVWSVFQPEYSRNFVQKRWAWILQKYRLQVDKMQGDFQDKFAKAYEDGLVPPLNFDKLQDYDWSRLIDWTLQNLDAPNSGILPSLPSSRPRLDDIFEVQEANEKDLSELYEINIAASIPKRIAMANRDPYAVPLRTTRPSRVDRLEIAKTWVRANIITPESTYNPTTARTKLALIGEENIEVALKHLLSDRTLVQENKGRLVPGRNYDISEHFVSRLRTNIEVSHFKSAVAFKAQLDTDVAGNMTPDFSWHADDGTVIAVLNMLAHKRVKIRPRNPPMDKFGLTDGNYKTRFMDKARLHFDVSISATESYTPGNPLVPLPLPPCQHLDDTLAKIPTWYDINGDFVHVMWEMALAAVMAVLAVRPGASASDIEKCVRPSLGEWEIEAIMGWIVNAKAGKWVGEGRMRGVTVEEWWWMCLAGDGERASAGEEKEKEREM